MKKTLRKKRRAHVIRDKKTAAIYGALLLLGFFALLFGVLFIRSCVIEDRQERELSLKIVFDDTYTIRVHNHRTGETGDVGLEEYIFHVIAGEMPAAYGEEALKAQAVAARTYSVQKCASIMGSSAHKCSSGGGEWDICTDSSCCQTWKSKEGMKVAWGKQYYEYSLKVYRAVMDTKGQILTYNGKPINAMYHSASGGFTENIEDVYGGDPVPYLRAVKSEGEEDFSDYETRVQYSLQEAAVMLNKEFGTHLTATSLRKDIEIIGKTNGGTVTLMRVGDKRITGKDFRRVMSLKSAKFTFSFDNRYVIIKVRGYGHCVGMSQTGAGAMAKRGADYRAILLHYYTDVEIRNIGDLR